MEGSKLSNNTPLNAATEKSNIVSARKTIPTTSYDLLEGTFKAATQARNVGLILLLVSLSAVLFVGSKGLLTHGEISSANGKYNALHAQDLSVLASLGTVKSNSGTIAAPVVISRSTAIGNSLRTMGEAEPMFAEILDEVQARLNGDNNIAITSIKFCSQDPTNGQWGSDTVVGGCAPADPVKGDIKNLFPVQYMEIDCSAPNLSLISTFISNLMQIPYLQKSSYNVNQNSATLYFALAPGLFPNASRGYLTRLGFTNVEVNSNPPTPNASSGVTK